MSETCRGHLWDKIIIKLFASSWYIFLTIKSVRTANKTCSEFGPNKKQRTRDVDTDIFSRNTSILRNSQTTVTTEGHLNTSLPNVPHQKKTPPYLNLSVTGWLSKYAGIEQKWSQGRSKDSTFVTMSKRALDLSLSYMMDTETQSLERKRTGLWG